MGLLRSDSEDRPSHSRQMPENGLLDVYPWADRSSLQALVMSTSTSHRYWIRAMDFIPDFWKNVRGMQTARLR